MYSNPTVTYIRERNEFRVAATRDGNRYSIGTVAAGSRFRPESDLFSHIEAELFAVASVNAWLADRIK